MHEYSVSKIINFEYILTEKFIKVLHLLFLIENPQPAADTTKSPRLSSSDLSALLTIIDDEAGAGLFRIQPKADTIMEESGRISFSIQRVGGSQGRVTVMVATIDGNPDSSKYTSTVTSPSFEYIEFCF